MTDFNKRPSETAKNCGNCYMGIVHSALGLLCGYDEKPTARGDVCGLYIQRHGKNKEEKDEKQEELF